MPPASAPVMGWASGSAKGHSDPFVLKGRLCIVSESGVFGEGLGQYLAQFMEWREIAIKGGSNGPFHLMVAGDCNGIGLGHQLGRLATASGLAVDALQPADLEFTE